MSDLMTTKVLIQVGDGWVDAGVLRYLKKHRTPEQMDQLETAINGRTIRTLHDLQGD